jgi:hypothetical protein
VHVGGKAVLPLTPLFNGIATHPWAPEFWWVHVLLLSTMIPSLINLAIGGTALMHSRTEKARQITGLFQRRWMREARTQKER